MYLTYVGDPTKLCCEIIFSAGFAAEEQLECLLSLHTKNNIFCIIFITFVCIVSVLKTMLYEKCYSFTNIHI